MFAPVVTLSAATIFLCIHSVILYKEHSLGRRIFLVGFRSFLDRTFTKARNIFIDIKLWFVTYELKITWHRTAHSFLKSFRHILHNLFIIVEKKMHFNSLRLKDLKSKSTTSEKSHLSEVSDHKHENSLSDDEKIKLKRDKLG